MNPKQIGAVVLMAGIFIAVQLGMMFQNKAKGVDLEIEKVRGEERELATQLGAEKDLLSDNQKNSSGLLGFVSKWRPYFALMEEKQGAETSISMKVREEGMLTLSARYEEVDHKISNKDIRSLPVLVRATLEFDDSFPKLLNWFGSMEKIKPTMRVGKLVLEKGSRADDLHMELVLEVPLLAKKKG